MYNLQWLKLEKTIFSNRKIQLLLKERDGDLYFRIWIQLLTIALECNSNGKLIIAENNPITIDIFSKIMGKSKKKIEKILQKFLELKMIVFENNMYIIKNWDKYQSIESNEKYKEQNRIRQARYRENKKSENEKSNVKITENNAEEEIREDKIENKKEGDESINGFREYKM